MSVRTAGACALLAALTTIDAVAALPAFPGAEGFGADTPGGRGGRVIEVTTLEDCLVPAVGCTTPVPGSLRAALQANGPRTIVFRVSGTIEIDWQIPLRNPFVTIAGQSAPGGGIAIRNGPTNTLHALSIQTHDVVLRHLRFRPGRSTATTEVSDGLNLANGASNVVIDHCSFSWAVDEGLDLGYSNPAGQSTHDVTIQWSMISEGLARDRSTWPPGFTLTRCSDALASGDAEPCFHSKAVLAGTNGSQSVATERIAFHHNFLAHNHDRNPLVAGSGRWDLVNNVVFDPNSLMGSDVTSLCDYEQLRLDVNSIGNYTRRRVPTLSYWAAELRLMRTATGPGFLVYAADNIVRDGPGAADLPGDTVCWDLGTSAYCTAPLFASFQRTTPWPSSLTTPPLSALAARDTVPFSAGATLPTRDPVDRCVIAHYCHQATEATCLSYCQAQGGCPTAGGLIDRPEDGCGPWPDLAYGSPPPDADHDGMPDAWELAHQFDPGDDHDAPLDADLDGYTNVEEYLNQTGPRDADEDGVLDLVDNCRLTLNPDQQNSDADDHGDACDNCDLRANVSQRDLDLDGEGDECDLDDGVVFFEAVTHPTISWQPDPSYSRFNLYRGSLAVLIATGSASQAPGSDPCAERWCGVVVTAHDDSFVPTAGEACYWLVAGVGTTGEEPLGDGAGVVRRNDFPCP